MRPVTTTKQVWSTDYVEPTHAFYLQHLAAQRGPTPSQRRAAHQAQVRTARLAQLIPNVCTALPLMGHALVPTAVVRYQ